MQIINTSQECAERISPNSNTALISIISPGSSRSFKQQWKNFLPLEFNDAIYSGNKNKIFTKKDAAKIKDFVKELPKTIDTIIVHCEGGISRSAAVAKYLSEKYNQPNFYERYNELVYKILKEK